MNQVFVEHRECSLLGVSFDGLWVRALNAAHTGQAFDYFAMLHADIGPEDFWLDKLIAEMEAKELDVLSVVIPIKDQQGITSTALNDPENTWQPRCRLTTHEVQRLPETFTSDDAGHQLLLNTGCWVCKFDLEWCQRVNFQVNNRIVFSEPDDRFAVEVEPEDWYFSRLCHEVGVRIGATRKIHATHRGLADYDNQKAWGAEFDRRYLTESLIPAADKDGFVFPAEVQGWLLYEEGRALAELAKGKHVLEIGSYCGRSSVCIGQTAAHLTCVDTWDGEGTPEPRDTRLDFDANMSKYRINHTVLESLDSVNGCQFDLAFIDGSHDRQSVQDDIDRASMVLKDGGLLVFHDYRRMPGDHDGRWDPGVTEAVNALLIAGGELIETHKTLAVVRPPALVTAA